MAYDDRDRDTVVVSDDRGSGMGAVLGILAIVILLVAVWFFALGPGSGGGTTTNNNNTINNPPAAPSLEVPTSS